MRSGQRKLIILGAALSGVLLIAVAVGRLFAFEWAMVIVGVSAILVAADMIIDENRTP